jgi:hypothetical protein
VFCQPLFCFFSFAGFGHYWSIRLELNRKNGYLNHMYTFVTGHVYQKNTNLQSVTQNPLLEMETNIALFELLEEETFPNFWTDVEIVIIFIKLSLNHL